MKIIALEAENIKKLVAIEIKPEGNLVQISGKNGAGKTSVLDSIWWALCGAANIQGTPIRKGETKARIKLDLGEIVVTRTFEKQDNNTVSKILIENAEGTVIRQPQTMLDRLLGELSFDPLAFSRMTKREQFDQLKRFVPDVDFDAIEKAQQKDYDERTNINRQVHEAKILAESIFVNVEKDQKPVDEMSIVDELEDAGKHNADIETRKANRQRLANEAATLVQQSENSASRAADLRRQSENLLTQAESFDRQVSQMNEERLDIMKKLAAAPPLPEPVDVTIIRRDLENAKRINEKFKALEKKQEHIDTMERYEGESEVITQRMNARQKDKEDKIASAVLPVHGLGFGNNEILMNAIPFAQASDAEQLRVSIGIAMALNPKLRVIRVRDGSLLDEDSMKMLSDMADAQDYQVWVERVGEDDKVGFVLVEGHIKIKEKINA